MLPAGEDPLPGGSNLPDPCPKKCKYCLQRLDVVESVPVEDYVAGKEPKSERQAVRDPTLAVMGLDDGDDNEKRQILLFNFSLYDGNGHLVPINDDLIFRRRDFKLHFNGVMKAIYSSDDDGASNDDSGIAVEGAGPITEWWITGLGKDEIPMVGLSTDLADYYLKNPSSAYSKIYSDLADKVKLTGVVYGILEEVMEKGTLNAFSYEDMLDELASKDQDINEETLLQYGAFIVQQGRSVEELQELSEYINRMLGLGLPPPVPADIDEDNLEEEIQNLDWASLDNDEEDIPSDESQIHQASHIIDLSDGEEGDSFVRPGGRVVNCEDDLLDGYIGGSDGVQLNIFSDVQLEQLQDLLATVEAGEEDLEVYIDRGDQDISRSSNPLEADDLHSLEDSRDLGDVDNLMAVYEDSGFATEDVDRSIVEGEIETSEQNNKSKQRDKEGPVPGFKWIFGLWQCNACGVKLRKNDLKHHKGKACLQQDTAEASKSEETGEKAEKLADGKFGCRLCGKAFSTERGVAMHYGVHKRTHKCNICKEQLLASEAASHYRLKHTRNKQKPMRKMVQASTPVAPPAVKRSVQPQPLQRRLDEEQEERPRFLRVKAGSEPSSYKCTGCPKAVFASFVAFNHHFTVTHLNLKSMEGNTAKYRYLNNEWTCAVCNVKLKKEALKQHYYRTHGEYKDKSSCSHCQQLVSTSILNKNHPGSIGSSCNLVKRQMQEGHKKVEEWADEPQFTKVEGGVAHQCYLCDTAFASLVAIKAHHQVAHVGKVKDPGFKQVAEGGWFCDHCNTSLKRYSLANHYWRHHHTEDSNQPSHEEVDEKCAACDFTIGQGQTLSHYLTHYLKDTTIKSSVVEGAVRCSFCRAIVSSDIKSLKSHLEVSPPCIGIRAKATKESKNKELTCGGCATKFSKDQEAAHYREHFHKSKKVVLKGAVKCSDCKAVVSDVPAKLKSHVESGECPSSQSTQEKSGKKKEYTTEGCPEGKVKCNHCKVVVNLNQFDQHLAMSQWCIAMRKRSQKSESEQSKTNEVVKKFDTKQLDKGQLYWHVRNDWYCKVCNLKMTVFNSDNEVDDRATNVKLKEHYPKVHSKVMSNLCVCQHCDQIFLQQSSLKKHNDTSLICKALRESEFADLKWFWVYSYITFCKTCNFRVKSPGDAANHYKDAHAKLEKPKDVQQSRTASKRKSTSPDEFVPKKDKSDQVSERHDSKATKRKLPSADSETSLTPSQAKTEKDAPAANTPHVKKVGRGHQCTHCHRVFNTKQLAQLHYFRNHGNYSSSAGKDRSMIEDEEGPTSPKRAKPADDKQGNKWRRLTKVANGCKCNICGRVYKNYNSAYTHLSQAHADVIRAEKDKSAEEQDKQSTDEAMPAGDEDGNTRRYTKVANGCKCNICGRVYKNSNSARSHITAVHGDQNKADKETRSQEDPVKETIDKNDDDVANQIVLEGRLHQCKPCGKKFKSKSMAMNHYKKRHSNEKSRDTEVIEKSVEKLRNQNYTKVGQFFKCKLCAKKYATKNLYNSHYMARHHDREAKEKAEKSSEGSSKSAVNNAEDLNGNDGPSGVRVELPSNISINFEGSTEQILKQMYQKSDADEDSLQCKLCLVSVMVSGQRSHLKRSHPDLIKKPTLALNEEAPNMTDCNFCGQKIVEEFYKAHLKCCPKAASMQIKLLPQSTEKQAKKVNCKYCGNTVTEDLLKFHLRSPHCLWKRKQLEINPKSLVKKSAKKVPAASNDQNDESFWEGLADMCSDSNKDKANKEPESETSKLYNSFKKVSGEWFCLTCNRKLRSDESLVSHEHVDKPETAGLPDENLAAKIEDEYKDVLKQKLKLDVPMMNFFSFIKNGVNLFECTMCKEKFRSQADLFKHYLEHDMKEFPSKYSFVKVDKRVSLNQSKSKYTCDWVMPDGSVCGHASKSPYDLKVHQFKHDNSIITKWVCKQCSKPFPKPSLLMKHLMGVHKVDEKEARTIVYQNTETSEAPSDQGKESPAVLTNDGKSKINSQGKGSKKKPEMDWKTEAQNKVLEDLNIKVYNCKYELPSSIHKGNICNQSFVSKQAYDKHMERHLNIKPHTCQFCTDSFSQKHELKDHLINEHKLVSGSQYLKDQKKKTKKEKTTKEDRKKGEQKSQKQVKKAKSVKKDASIDKNQKTLKNDTPEIKKELGEAKKQSFQVGCLICDQSFSTQKELDSHMPIHDFEPPAVTVKPIAKVSKGLSWHGTPNRKITPGLPDNSSKHSNQPLLAVKNAPTRAENSTNLDVPALPAVSAPVVAVKSAPPEVPPPNPNDSQTKESSTKSLEGSNDDLGDEESRQSRKNMSVIETERLKNLAAGDYFRQMKEKYLESQGPTIHPEPQPAGELQKPPPPKGAEIAKAKQATKQDKAKTKRARGKPRKEADRSLRRESSSEEEDSTENEPQPPQTDTTSSNSLASKPDVSKNAPDPAPVDSQKPGAENYSKETTDSASLATNEGTQANTAETKVPTVSRSGGRMETLLALQRAKTSKKLHDASEVSVAAVKKEPEGTPMRNPEVARVEDTAPPPPKKPVDPVQWFNENFASELESDSSDGDVYTCSYCSFSGPSETVLREHMDAEHGQQNMRTCEKCKEEFRIDIYYEHFKTCGQEEALTEEQNTSIDTTESDQ